MNTRSLHLLLVVLLVPALSHATLCSTVEECRDLAVLLQYREIDVRAEIPDKLTTAIFDGPIPLLTTQGEAELRCNQKKSRLLTAREYAEIGEARGAKGIIETAYTNTPISDPLVQSEIQTQESAGYFTIYKTTRSGKISVDFYYNRTGYKEFGPYDFNTWTSSENPTRSGTHYTFSGGGLSSLEDPLPFVKTRCLRISQPLYCNEGRECYDLYLKVEAEAQKLGVKIEPKLGPLEKDVSGVPLELDWLEARDHCAGKGLRLPTTREGAKYAMSRGGFGFRETAFPNKDSEARQVKDEIAKNTRATYIAILKPTATKYSVDFYFSARLRQLDCTALNGERFWTENQSLVGGCGITGWDPTRTHHVRCLK